MSDVRPYISTEIAVPAKGAFGVKSEPVRIRDRAGRDFDLDRDQLDAVLAGSCHRCGEPVDHTQGDIPVGDDDHLHFDIAVIKPVDHSGGAPTCAADALDMGWGIAPICSTCRRKAVGDGRKALDRFRWDA